MYIVISIFLLFYTVFGHEGHVHSGQTNDIKEFVKNQEEKAAQQNFEQKDVMQVVPKTYGQMPQMPNMMQAQNIGQPQMPGQQPPPQILQLLQMLLGAQNGQMRPMNGQMPPMMGEPDKIDPDEGYNSKCDEDPMLRNGDDCGDYALRKQLKGTYTSQAWKCNTFECICPHMGGNFIQNEGDGRGVCILPSGRSLTKAIRKEYRTLSDEERHRYHAAVKKLMEIGIFDEISALHLNITRQHSAHYMDKANANVKFWTWHQHYIKRFEFELRKIDPDLAIPYWDSTLDENLPASRDSIMWTDDFMGRTDENGTVISGPGAHWLTLNGQLLKRRPVFWGPLFKEADLKFWLGESQLDMPRHPVKMFSCRKQVKELFNMHGNVHHYLGQDLPTATNDPVFYTLHSWMELLFKIWTQQKDRNCHIPGLIDDEIDETVEYEKRPTCTREKPSCGSKYLFCDQTQPEPRCAVKIRVGGVCEGLNNRDQPCLNGICQHNRCVEIQQPTLPTLAQNPMSDLPLEEPEPRQQMSMVNLAGRFMPENERPDFGFLGFH